MTETMNQTQINAGRELVAYLKNKYGISKNIKMYVLLIVQEQIFLLMKL